MRLKDKIVIVTGGANGIGAAATARFAEEGATVLAVDIDERNGESLARKLVSAGLRCEFIVCDVSNSKDVINVIDQIKNTHGRLDVIYNNASVFIAGADGKVTDILEETWDKVIAINLKSVFLFCKYGIPLMIESGGGSIINTASSAGVIGIPGCDAYTASKGGTIQMTKSMAVEYGPEGIRVNCIAPAAIKTDMVAQSNSEESGFDEERFLKLRTPMRRYGTPEEIASIALFLASDESSYLNGSVIVADGGVTINGDLSKINI